jgi:MFS family permease
MPEAHAWQARLPFFYGWVIVVLGFVASLFGIGLTWATGLLAVPMVAELGWSYSAIFFAVSLRGWMGIVITPMIGRYLDRRDGPRTLALVGGLINTATLILIAQANMEWQFVLLFGVIGGVAQSAQSGISVALVPKWFVRRRGTAVSISTLGGGMAAFVLPALLGGLIAAGGWRTGWTVLGVAAFVLGTLPAVLLRREPEDVGLLPDGDRTTHRAEPRTPAVRTSAEQSFTVREAMRTSAFWVLVVGMAVGSLANNGIPATITTILVDRGLPFELAVMGLTWYGIASLSTKLIWGWVTNRVHIRKVLLILTAYGAVALPSIVFLPREMGALALAYGFLSGVYIGAYVFLSQLVWADYFGRAHVGAISSVGRPLGLIFGASGPFLLAFTRDLTGSYDLGILLNGLSAALCFACLLLVRPVRRPSTDPTLAQATTERATATEARPVGS